MIVKLSPDILDLVDKLGLGDAERAELIGLLGEMPADKHQKYLIEFYKDLPACDEDDEEDF